MGHPLSGQTCNRSTKVVEFGLTKAADGGIPGA